MSVALITGGSRGIGRVIAREFAREGYDIAICYSGNDKAAEETKEWAEGMLLSDSLSLFSMNSA